MVYTKEEQISNYNWSENQKFKASSYFFNEITKFSPISQGEFGQNIIDPEKNQENINRLLDCYFFETISCLDVLAHKISIILDFKIGDVYFDDFFSLKKGKAGDLGELLKGKNLNLYNIIEEAIKKPIYKDLSDYRGFTTHESVSNPKIKISFDFPDKVSLDDISIPKNPYEKFSEDNKINVVDFVRESYLLVEKIKEKINKELKQYENI